MYTSIPLVFQQEGMGDDGGRGRWVTTVGDEGGRRRRVTKEGDNGGQQWRATTEGNEGGQRCWVTKSLECVNHERGTGNQEDDEEPRTH